MKYIGINRDTHPKDTPEGFGLGAKNGNNNKVIGSSVNEDGLLIYQSDFNKYNISKTISGINYILRWNGEILLDDNKFLVFSIGYRITAATEALTAPLFSEIGILDNDGTYTPIINDFTFSATNKLNFNPVYPIRGEFTVDGNGNTIVAATDFNNQPLYVNVSKYIQTPVLSGDLAINNLLMFPVVNTINTGISISENEGAIDNGVYYLQYRYKNEDLSVTTNLLTSNPIFIVNAALNSTKNIIKGDLIDIKTSKKINLTLTNVNTAFTSLEIIAVIKRVSGTVAKILKTINISNSTINTSIDSSEGIDISLQEVLTPQVKFKKVYKFTQVYNRLYAAKTELSTFRGFQKYANIIKLKWISKIKDLPLDNFNSARPIQNFNEKTFLHKEVYAFYIHLELIDGTITEGFHIPALSGKSNSDIESDGYRDISILTLNQGVNGIKRFQVEDFELNRVQNTTTQMSGDFGLWENEDEVYPNTDEFDQTSLGGVDLRGQKVRHHRFPSMQYIKSTITDNTIQQHYGKSMMDTLGFFIDNLYFPPELEPLIKGYFISYAQRDYNNCTVLGRSTGRLQSKFTTQTNLSNFTDEFSTGLNRKIVKIALGTRTAVSTPITPYFMNTDSTVITNETVLRLYDLDLLKNKPDISPVYLWQDLYCRKLYEGLGAFEQSTDTNGNLKVNLNNIIDDTVNKVVISPNDFGVNNSVRMIKTYEYIPERINKEGINNGLSEDFIRIVLDSQVQGDDVNKRVGIRSLIFQDIEYDVFNMNDFDSFLGKYDGYYLHSIMANPSNCYFDFTKQKLVSTGVYFDKTNFGTPIYGGDGFVTLQTYHTIGWGGLHRDWVLNGVNLASDTYGLKMVHGQLMTSRNNYQLLDIQEGNAAFQFYPRYNPDYIIGLGYGWAKVNTLYNDNYSSINNLITLIPYDYNIISNNINKNRINRCIANNPESRDTGWRTWLINDYYETPKNKGEIINIEGNDRDLFITLKRATFTTVGNEQINVDGSLAFIGAGNIFERPAIELIPSKEGTLGSQHLYSCLLTQSGYVFIDSQTGVIALLSKANFEVISNKGMQRWLFDNLKFKSNIQEVLKFFNKEFSTDNPYNGVGFTTGIDYVYDRIFITKKDYSLTPTGVVKLYLNEITFANGRFLEFNAEVNNFVEIPFTNTTIFEDNSFTLSYNLKNKVWDYFHDFIPSKYNVARAKTIVVGSKPFVGNTHIQSIPYVLNEGKKGMYIDNSTVYNKDIDVEHGIPYGFYISKVFNKGDFKKDFKNLTWITEVLNANKAILLNETFTDLLAFTSIGSTPELTLLPFDFNNYFNTNIRLLKGEWNFNDLRNYLRNDLFTNPLYEPFIRNYLELNQADINLNKPFETIDRLIDYYLVVKYIYNSLDYYKEIRILQTNASVLPVPR